MSQYPANLFQPRVINCVNQTDLSKIQSVLLSRGYRVFELDGKCIHDKKSFFLQAAKDLPQPHDLIAFDNWDALLDNLWWSLSETPETQIAILWSNVHLMLDGGLPDLLMAVSCFEQLAMSIATAEHGFPRSTSLQIFLGGDGPNFPENKAEQ